MGRLVECNWVLLSCRLQVLSRLLPIVIGKLGPSASPAVQKKVGQLGVLSTARSSRARGPPACAHAHMAAGQHSPRQSNAQFFSPRSFQVLEILSHANKRTRALPALRLPLKELAELYAGAWFWWFDRLWGNGTGSELKSAAVGSF